MNLIRIPRRSVLFAAALGVLASVGTAAAQPTQAQLSAVRSACPSDYRAMCSNISPGTPAALSCLQQNVGKLSASCKSAVSATMAPSGSGSAAAPAAAPAAQAPAAQAPAAATTTAAPATSSAPGQSAPAAAKAAPAPAAPKTAVVAPPPPAAYAQPPMRVIPLREEAIIIRTACGPDYRAYCGGIPPGGGRIIACLRANARALSANCQGALMGR